MTKIESVSTRQVDADRALRKAGLVRVSEFRLRDRWRPGISCKRRIETCEEIWVVCKQARTIGKSPHARATIDAELINPKAQSPFFRTRSVTPRWPRLVFTPLRATFGSESLRN